METSGNPGSIRGLARLVALAGYPRREPVARKMRRNLGDLRLGFAEISIGEYRMVTIGAGPEIDVWAHGEGRAQRRRELQR